MLSTLHFITGALALMGGAFALLSRKGGALHRLAGKLYGAAMLAMGSTGSVLAWVHAKPLSLWSGLLVCYLVLTGWGAVRRPVREVRGWLIAGMLAALTIGAALLALAAGVLERRSGDLVPSLVFAAVALAAAALDARLLLAGEIGGRHRLARHLWRLGFAMLMATTAFFLGQARLFPEPVRKLELLVLPVLAVLGATVYVALRLWLRGRRGVAA